MSRKGERSWEEYAETISKDPKWSEFKAKLARLKGNSKTVIHNLTEYAKKNKVSNRVIVVCLVKKIIKTEANERLKYLYLMDSIVKNVGGGYSEKFGSHAPGIVASTIKHGTPETKQAVHRLIGTWKSDKIFPQTILDKVSDRIKNYQPKRKRHSKKADSYSPHTKKVRTETSSKPEFSPLISEEQEAALDTTPMSESAAVGAELLDNADLRSTDFMSISSSSTPTADDIESQSSIKEHKSESPPSSPTPTENSHKSELELTETEPGDIPVGSHPLTTDAKSEDELGDVSSQKEEDEENESQNGSSLSPTQEKERQSKNSADDTMSQSSNQSSPHIEPQNNNEPQIDETTPMEL